jgi:Family of unknown function (DUF5985)
MHDFLMGGIAVASLLAGLYFFRFWRQTHDRFFVFFALSFWIEAANRFAMMAQATTSEDLPLHYLVRLVAYGLIIAAIVDKNRGRR